MIIRWLNRKFGSRWPASFTFRHCNIPYPLPAAFSIIVAAAATPYCLQLELSLKAPAQTSDKSRKICTQRRTFDRSGQGKCAGSFIWISSSFVTLDELHLLLLHLWNVPRRFVRKSSNKPKLAHLVVGPRYNFFIWNLAAWNETVELWFKCNLELELAGGLEREVLNYKRTSHSSSATALK